MTITWTGGATTKVSTDLRAPTECPLMAAAAIAHRHTRHLYAATRRRKVKFTA